MVSSLVNVGSGRDFTTGMGTRTLDANFIGLRTFPRGRWRGRFSPVWKRFRYLSAPKFTGAGPSAEPPELGASKHVDGNANSTTGCVQNCTVFICSYLIRHINPRAKATVQKCTEKSKPLFYTFFHAWRTCHGFAMGIGMAAVLPGSVAGNRCSESRGKGCDRRTSDLVAVSYTHLDVYKRQVPGLCQFWSSA